MASEDLVRRMLDEVEIRNLICRLAQLADESDASNLNEYISLFTEDATWDFRPALGGTAPDRSRRGHADIIAGAKERRAGGVQGPGTHTRHVITTTAVKLNGDAATATSYMFFYKNADKTPEPIMLVVLTDNFRRAKDGWKLASRFLTPG